MTYSELYHNLKKQYSASPKAVEMFTFRDLWIALCEKYGIKPDLQLVCPEKTAEAAGMIIEDAHKLISGYPLQYYIGYTEFCGLSFICRENVLIPRVDSELAVELVCDNLPQGGRFADICCGSGCIAISVLKRRPDARAIAIDIAPEAILLTADNADALGVKDRIEVIRCDLFSETVEKTVGKFLPDIVVSNPPYIRSSDMKKLPENVLREPALALEGGEDGLVFYRRLAELFAGKYRLVLEIGFDEADALSKIADKYRLQARVFRDGGGRDRAVIM